MGNLESYIRWRGDLTFAERPFCEVDNLVFCELVYFDFAGILPRAGSGERMTLRQAVEQFRRQGRDNTAGFGLSASFLDQLARSSRYGGIGLSDFKEVLDEEEKCEFAAMTIHFSPRAAFLAYRGTGDTLTGWEEDFRMSFQSVPAQQQAADYLRQAARATDGRLYLGGHSKGGNLAVYAAMMCQAEQERIVAVYSNDGPGFCPQLLDPERYRRIEHRIIRIVPEFCVVGRLFETNAPDRIVASSESGLLQHSGGSWQIEGDHFCTRPALSPRCRRIDQIVDTWIESASMEQREAFVKELFRVLEQDGIRRLSQLSCGGIDTLEDVLLRLTASSSENARAVVVKFVSALLEQIRQTDFKKLLQTREMTRGIIGFALGLLFMIAPQGASRLVGLALCFAVLVRLGRRVLKNFDDPPEPYGMARTKTAIQLVALSGASFLSAVVNLVFSLTNLLVGAFFLSTAFFRLKKALTEAKTGMGRVMNLLIAAVALCLGVVPIVSRGLLWADYAFLCGTFLVLFGVVEICEAMVRESGC